MMEIGLLETDLIKPLLMIRADISHRAQNSYIHVHFLGGLLIGLLAGWFTRQSSKSVVEYTGLADIVEALMSKPE